MSPTVALMDQHQNIRYSVHRNVWYSIERWTMSFVSIGIPIPAANKHIHTLTHVPILREWSICRQSILIYVHLKTFMLDSSTFFCWKLQTTIAPMIWTSNFRYYYHIIHHFEHIPIILRKILSLYILVTILKYFANSCESATQPFLWRAHSTYSFKNQKRWIICCKIAIMLYNSTFGWIVSRG